ncbi:MAG: hypothetical protein MUC48_24320 [Leptolyngbya sp. Prado105]|jgi:hypothetical protein|nr:hypothetical protein [Leptolyngbya sp. Prado105]
MIRVKTVKQIATSRVILGSRALPSLSRLSTASLDRARVIAGIGQLHFDQARHYWLNRSSR